VNNFFKKFKKDKLIVKLFKNIITTSALKAINILLMLGVTILLARSLGSKNYGIYTFALSIILILGLPTKIGLPLLILKETVKYHIKQKWSHLHGLLFLSNAFVIIFSILIATIVLITSWWAWHDNEIVKTNVLFWGLLLLPLIAFANLRGATLTGLGKFIQGNLPEQLIQPLAIFLLLVVTVWLGNELTPVMAMHYNIIAAFAAFFIGATMLKRALPKQIFHAKRSYEVKMWRLSLTSLMTTKALIIINSQLSIIMLGFLDFTDQVGFYRVAITGSTLVAFGLTVTTTVVAPQIAKLYNLGDTKKLQRIVTSSSRMIMIISLPIILVFIFFSEQLIQLLFGVEYIHAGTALVILSLGQLINSLTGPAATVLNMTGHEKQNVGGALLGLVLNVILFFMLTPAYGLIGAAIATAVSLIVWQLFLTWLTYKHTGIKTFVHI
jgi:O-antigen/teichoic acid export membrane protein